MWTAIDVYKRQVEAYRKYDGAERPVGKHTDPDCNRAKTPNTAEIDTKAHTAEPHGACLLYTSSVCGPDGTGTDFIP